MLESKIQQSIQRVLKSYGCLAIKQESPPVGIPDLLVLTGDGTHFWIEVKQPNGMLSPCQKTFHIKLTRRGDRVYICRNKQDAIDALNDFKGMKYNAVNQ